MMPKPRRRIRLPRSLSISRRSLAALEFESANESFVSGAVSREMSHDRDIREAVTPQRRLKGGAGSENRLACDETRRPVACRRVYP